LFRILTELLTYQLTAPPAAPGLTTEPDKSAPEQSTTNNENDTEDKD
jgi:hypothetical protein